MKSPVRVVVLADIHGNLPALHAALAEVQVLSPDSVVVCGDVVNGSPDSRECWDILQSFACPLLRGNHERYVAHYDRHDAPPEWRTERFAPVRFSAAQFSDTERQTMMEMPSVLRLPELPEIVFCHASPRADADNIIAHTPDTQIAAMLEGVPEPIIVRGHQHVQQARGWNGKTIITSGSVGLPLEHAPAAQFLLLEKREGHWHFQHKSIPYDLEKVKQRYHDSGYISECGVMARLYLREVLTASYQIVPFLRSYIKWSPDNSLPLDVALERFWSNDDL